MTEAKPRTKVFPQLPQTPPTVSGSSSFPLSQKRKGLRSHWVQLALTLSFSTEKKKNKTRRAAPAFPGRFMRPGQGPQRPAPDANSSSGAGPGPSPHTPKMRCGGRPWLRFLPGPRHKLLKFCIWPSGRPYRAFISAPLGSCGMLACLRARACT